MSWTKDEGKRIDALHDSMKERDDKLQEAIGEIKTAPVGDISGDPPGIIADLRVNSTEHKTIFRRLRWLMILVFVALVVGGVAASERLYVVVKALSNIL